MKELCKCGCSQLAEATLRPLYDRYDEFIGNTFKIRYY